MPNRSTASRNSWASTAPASFADTLVLHLRNVQRQYSQLFEPVAQSPDRALRFPKDEDDRETLDRLAGMGFRNPLEISATVRSWLSGRYLALRSDFARSQLAQLIPHLLEHLARNENREQALLSFDRFLSGLHAAGGARLISLLLQHPDLLALVALMLGTAPRLADILAHQPQAMDALLDPAFFGVLPDATVLSQELTRSLDQSVSYEDMLDRLRLFGHEHMFLIGVRILSGTVSAEQAGEAYARLADVIICSLHNGVEKLFAETHGYVRGQQTAWLALGKLGGREMTASSDLDLILMYDFDEAHPESDGARSLYGATIFRAPDQALHLGADRAHDLRRALSRRYAAAPVRAIRAGGDQDRFLPRISEERSLDLGAYGADARARGVGDRRLRLAGGRRDPRGAGAAARL